MKWKQIIFVFSILILFGCTGKVDDKQKNKILLIKFSAKQSDNEIGRASCRERV